MHVLDIGCGVGDLSLMAARLVGYQGRVTAIDVDEMALNTAQGRAQELGVSNVSFVRCGVENHLAGHEYDAVTGRHILIHTPNPLSILQSTIRLLRKGGVAVFQEFDFSAVHPAYPASPLREQVLGVFREFFCRATQGAVGSKLFHLFLKAGFATPDCRVEYPMDGGPDSPFYEWMAESYRSILPHVEAMGLARDLNVDTLAERLREEAVGNGAGFPGPVMVGGFARKS